MRPDRAARAPTARGSRRRDPAPSLHYSFPGRYTSFRGNYLLAAAPPHRVRTGRVGHDVPGDRASPPARPPAALGDPAGAAHRSAAARGEAATPLRRVVVA